MKNKNRNVNIEKYVEEGLLALLPRYQEGASGSLIFTLEGRHPDRRGVPWLVVKLASYYNLNLPELRRHCGQLLGLGHHISLPFSGNLVLLPVKVRQSATPGETTTGFINLLQVEQILPPPQFPSPGSGNGSKNGIPSWLSRVLFKCGLQLKTLNTAETLKGRLQHGEVVFQDFQKRRNKGITFTGLSRKVLLEQLPNCDCVLKEAFVKWLELD